jgi:integrase
VNQTDIKAARPGQTIRDDKVKGLMLRVFESKSCWYLNFRTKAGTERKPKLGDLSVMSLDQARKMAAELLIQVGAGADPMAARVQARGAPIVDELWSRYVDEHRKPWKTEKDQTRIWTKNIAPKIGARKVGELTYDDCYAVHKSMARAPYQANRTLALLSSMMGQAEKYGWRKEGSNPCRHVQRHQEKKRKRYMSPREASEVARLLRESEATARPSVAFIYLLTYTGARCGDIRNARWSMLDGNRLNLPDSKGGEKTVYLPDEAVAVLDKLPRTADGTITGIKSPQKVWSRIRKAAGCPDLRLHDIRHSFASVALAAGLSLAQIGELLGHKSAQTTKRYAHLMDDAASMAAQATASLIAERMVAAVS